MKKVVFCLAVFALMLSCEGNNWGDTVITNSSGFDVTFKFNHTDKFELLSGGTKKFETKAYQYLASYDPSKWVKFEFESTNEDYTGEFKIRDSQTVEIFNTLDKNVTLTAGGWLEKDCKDTVEIPAKYYDEENDVYIDGKETARIFTDKPEFTAVDKDDYPASVFWQIEDDTMKVTIR
jgi:hypothetical protein